MGIRVGVLLSLAACSAASTARAQIAWTEVATVAGKNPALAPAPNGGAHVIVADSEVRYVQLDAAGQKLVDEPVPGTGSAASSFSFGPALAVGAGAIHVAFAKELGAWMLTGHHVVKTASGWSSVLDLQAATERGYAPSIAVDANGAAHILFGAATSVPFGVANYYRVQAGVVSQAHPALIEWRADDRTAIVTGPNDAVVALAGRPSPSGYVAFASSSSGGTSFSAQSEIEPPNVGSQRVGQPHAVVDPAGIVHLVFGAGDDTSVPCNCAVHYATLSSGTVQNTTVVSPAGALEHWHLSLGISRIALLDGGVRVVTWQRHAGDDSAAPVSSSTSTDGTNWTSPQQVVGDCGDSEGRNTIDLAGSGNAVWLACPKGSSVRIFRGTPSTSVPCNPASPFAGASVSPANGSGPAQAFVTKISHCEGASKLRVVQLFVAQQVDPKEPAVAAAFEAGAFHLDTGSCNPGEAKKLTSAHGSLDCATSNATTSGNEMTVTFSLDFDTVTFAGERGLFVDAKGGTVSPEPRLGWTELGKFTVTSTPSGSGGAGGEDGGAGAAGVRGSVSEYDSGCGCGAVGRRGRTPAHVVLVGLVMLVCSNRRRARLDRLAP